MGRGTKLGMRVAVVQLLLLAGTILGIHDRDQEAKLDGDGCQADHGHRQVVVVLLATVRLGEHDDDILEVRTKS